MPRIPQTELDRLKADIDLTAFIQAKGIELKPHGTDDLIGRCPFHDDKTPSLIVTPSKGLWHCMGACQSGGDIFSWLMKSEGISFRHAVELIRSGHTPASEIQQQPPPNPKRPPPPMVISTDDQTLLNQVMDYYHQALKGGPTAYKAREYLQKRGIADPEALSTFRLGFANRTLGLHLPMKKDEDGRAIRTRLESLGVFRQSTGHEHLAGSLIIPILDESGNVQGLYGRKVLDTLRPGTAFHLYLPGPHRGLWNPSCLTENDCNSENTEKEIILCESIIDALSFWVSGYRNVTASYGVEGFTEEMLSAFISHGVKRVFIAYDRDEAGDKAAEKLSTKLLQAGIQSLRVQFPHGMDANEFICKIKEDETSTVYEALKLLLAGASPFDANPKSPTTFKSTTTVLQTGECVDLETGEVHDGDHTQSIPSLVDSVPVLASREPPLQKDLPSRLPHTFQGEDVLITLGDRQWRVRGLHKNLAFEVLKVNLRVTVVEKGDLGGRYYIDQLDLYNAKHRESFVSHAAVEVELKMDILKRDLGRILSLLEQLQEEKINDTLKQSGDKAYVMPMEEETEALELLKAPDLVDRIIDHLGICGYVGEETNKIMGYLAATSRKMDDPLHLLIQSSSAAGKSSLMDAILAMLPEEDVAQYSALTGQALFYMEGETLRHKVLAIAEDGGMEKAVYALKLLMTEKKLKIAAPGKDPETGKLVTQTYSVDGPSAIFYSTTSSEVDAELQNRCITLTVDESESQTDAILQLQRFQQTAEGKKTKRERDRLRKLHQNAQRLLKAIDVVNPYAAFLTFHVKQSRLRRDQMKYLGLMNTLAVLHQYQRPQRRDAEGNLYVEVTLSDIALANRLAAEVLGRTLDELAPQTRRLLELLTGMVGRIAKEQALEWPLIRLSRWDIRKVTGWGDTQLKIHLRRLVEMEYLIIYRGGRGLTYEYELLYRGEGKEGGRFLLGLIDMEELRKKKQSQDYDFERSGVNGHRSGSGRGSVGPRSGGGRGDETALSTHNDRVDNDSNTKNPENAYRDEKKSKSYVVLNHSDKISSSLDLLEPLAAQAASAQTVGIH